MLTSIVKSTFWILLIALSIFNGVMDVLVYILYSYHVPSYLVSIMSFILAAILYGMRKMVPDSGVVSEEDHRAPRP